MDKFKFKYSPILVGGKAMEYYNLRKTGDDIDYIIHKTDYKKLAKIIKPNELMPIQTPAITYKGGKIDIDYFLKLYNFDYNKLKRNAVKKENNLIVSKEDLILIKSMTAFDEKHKISKEAKEKNLKDIKLLVNSMI